jgi:hypothetical protein
LFKSLSSKSISGGGKLNFTFNQFML